ncbi:tRNA (adenosine(37)-N6)-threonylcarbamoyltransferase complex dimerization subunit type 1 TsaB [Rhizobium helianthi]|uniref:tRNA (Adenosine(37)-N6)-threonylcarbamoyltransferase complex dimerization subunit type 1 TsaB n=1 Tax=Rhizobium helianthi TaxID=1132695 RepID=A0ABW4M1I0_9HYPH
MHVLAIDTAGVDCSAAIYHASEKRVLSSVIDRIGKGHAERLMAMIEEALQAADLILPSIDRIAVTIGPGSFTGIRVGVAAARGLGLALDVDVVGVSTLQALAMKHLDEDASRPVIAAMDAKRNEIYAQAFDEHCQPLGQPESLSLDQLKALAHKHSATVTGSAVALLSGLEKSEDPDRFNIAIVAKLGAQAQPGVDIAKPLYLRGPDAKPQDGFALARA